MKKRKPNRRASTHYGPWHIMLASPDKPMQPSRYRHQLTRMHLALANITKGESPTDDDWRLIADAINLVETLVLQKVAQDESGLLHDAITAMAEAFYRADQDSARMRLTGPGLAAIRADTPALQAEPFCSDGFHLGAFRSANDHPLPT